MCQGITVPLAVDWSNAQTPERTQGGNEKETKKEDK